MSVYCFIFAAPLYGGTTSFRVDAARITPPGLRFVGAAFSVAAVGAGILYLAKYHTTNNKYGGANGIKK